jgi:predicted kinase
VTRWILLISGPPASGKSTIARELAPALGMALLTKDDIKESLYTSMGGAAGDVAFSRTIGNAAMELLWALAPHCPRVILEANFRTRSAYEREKLSALLEKTGASCIEIFCRIPLEEAARRFAERARTERHHPAHPLQEMSLERLSEYAEPFGMTPVIEVQTSGQVDVAALAERIRVELNAGVNTVGQLKADS